MDLIPKTFNGRMIVLMSGLLIIVIVIGAGLVLSMKTSVQLQDYGPTANFSLVDQNNEFITLDNFSGKVLVIDFIYSHCHDVCPLETSKMNNLLAKILDSGYSSSEFHFITISFDWKFDNASTLKNYALDRAEGQFDYWSFLSGTQTQIQNVTSQYGVYADYVNTTVNNTTVPIMTTQPGDHNMVDYMVHNQVVTIVDKQGIRRSVYNGPDWLISDMYSKLKLLLK